MARTRILLLLAVVGVLGGYVLVRFWPSPAAPAAVPPAASTPPPAAQGQAANQLPPLPQPRGSSFSVVGNMSREEMIRQGILPADAAPPPPGRVAAPDRRAAAGAAQRPPSSFRFPPELRTAAARYQCLCGRAHALDVCPCNDQPLGAVTMLTYLQKMMAVDADTAALDAAMVDRYGPRVMAPTPGD